MLPIYLLVVGAEGTGHHALETIWKMISQYYDTSIITYDEHFHGIRSPPNVSRAFACPTISQEYSRFLVKEYLRQPRVRGKQLIIDTRNSFPEGFGVASLSHPDIRHLAMLDGDLFDLRILMLTRDPTAATVSAVKRFYDDKANQDYKNYRFQARATQRLFSLINNNLPLLPCGKTLHISYEELTSNNTALAVPLASLLSVGIAYMQQSLGKIRPNAGVAETHKMQADHIEDTREFFALQRVMWPLLTRRPAISVSTALLVPRNKRAPIEVVCVIMYCKCF